jgi:O-antigen ligase
MNFRPAFDSVAQGSGRSAPEPFEPAVSRAAPLPRPLLGAVFLWVYLTWRPLEVMFTYSDALFLIGAAILLYKAQLPTHALGALTPLWLSSFSLFIGGLLVGSLVNGVPMRWLIVACQYSFSWVLLPLLLIGHGRENTFSLIKAMIAGIFAVQVLALLIYFLHGGTPQEVEALLGPEFLAGNRRIGAFVVDGNWNAATISMSMMFVIYAAIKRAIPIWVTIIVAIVLIVGLVLSASFTGFVGIVSALGIFAVVAAVRPRLRVILVAATIVAVLTQSGYSLPSAFETRVAAALANGNLSQAGTYEGRMTLIEEAWQIVENHTLVGLGVDQYRAVSEERAPVHNMYLLIWAEGGIPALLGWLGMLATILAVAVLCYRADRVTAALLISVLWTLLIFSMANPHMYNRIWAVPIALALATAFDAIRAVKGEDGRGRLTR